MTWATFRSIFFSKESCHPALYWMAMFTFNGKKNNLNSKEPTNNKWRILLSDSSVQKWALCKLN
jgi:hypothetical protein